MAHPAVGRKVIDDPAVGREDVDDPLSDLADLSMILCLMWRITGRSLVRKVTHYKTSQYYIKDARKLKLQICYMSVYFACVCFSGTLHLPTRYGTKRALLETQVGYTYPRVLLTPPYPMAYFVT